MDYKTIELKREQGIACVTLNRPEVLNALSERMKAELIHALQETEGDEDIRVMILTGRGRAFCAGADLNRFVEFQQSDKDHKKKNRFGSLDLPRTFIQYPKPIIAAINGPSYGFGFTVALTCDIRLASDRAKFSCAFVRIGVTPEFCSTYFLPRLIGYGKAAELVFSARPFDAQEALEMGAVNRVVPHRRLIPEAKKIAKQIVSMPPFAVQKSKEILRHGMQSTLDQVIQHEATVFIECMKTEEHASALRKLLAEMKSKRERSPRSRK
ncbi:MAG TPA: enoyl-CoA hydratase/isomerase family protein [Thermodesulfobacteriota bacterium]|nr:enoyl-CoA hydratase/isomerase family protein [Thermodesulfobacteriota bacterium]